MAEPFDPYHKWLGIRDPQRPPNHDRLLGLEPFENDPKIIDDASKRKMAHVRTFQLGPHSALSQSILNELAAARICLLDPNKKAAYDRNLRELRGVDDAIPTSLRAEPISPSPGLRRTIRPRKSLGSPWLAVATVMIVLLSLGTGIVVVVNRKTSSVGEARTPSRRAASPDDRNETSATTEGSPLTTQTNRGDGNGTDASIRTAEVAEMTPLPGRPAPEFKGLLLATELDCSENVYRLDIGTPIDVSQSWVLQMEFFMTNLDPGLHMLVIWGDERPGRDVFFVRQDGPQLQLAIQDCATNEGHAFFPILQPTMLNRWVPLNL